MKRLEKLLLINWHYIVHQELNLEPVTFLTGKNGAGKSTILDALQMLILGDTSGHFFNKAANSNARRTLKSYLFADVAEQEGQGVVYLRANQTFSSYVVAEFHDTVKKQRFCMGIVFDCDADGTHTHRFFSLFEELPTFHFIRDGVPLDIQGLRQWSNRLRKGRFELYETNKRYQDMFRSHMGNLGEKFFRLFRKAVPFEPIMDVAGFISEFVCDVEHRLDIADMRENIRHYRRLEADLGFVKRKVTALRQIQEQFQALAAVEDRLRQNQYLVDKARVVELEQTRASLQQQLSASEVELAELARQVAQLDEQLQRLQGERDGHVEERAQSSEHAAKQRIENRKQLLEAEFASILQLMTRQERHLLELAATWRATCEGMKEALVWFAEAVDLPRAEALRTELAEALQQAQGLLATLRAAYPLEGVGLHHFDAQRAELDVDVFTALQAGLTEVADGLRRVHQWVQSAVADWEQEQRQLAGVIADLRKGIKPYDGKVLQLQRAIAAELAAQTGSEVQITLFADALDIRDEAWHNAIEGYMHTQRFYLLVPPEHFSAALAVYDRVKREAHIHDVGLVDIGRIAEQRPERLAGSLAEEIVTDHPLARLYADFLLGRVMKCSDVQQLREHRTAVTVDGMLYQNFVVRQMDPRRWESLFIGKRALAQQLAQKQARLAAVEQALTSWTARARRLGGMARISPPSDGDVRDVIDAQQALTRVPPLQTELRQLLDELGSLNMAYLFDLDEKIRQAQARIRHATDQRDGAIRRQADGAARLRVLTEHDLPATEGALADAARLLQDKYADWPLCVAAQARFEQELARLGAPALVVTNFGRQNQTDLNRKEALWSELVTVRADYQRDFQAGFDIQRRDNQAYDAELQRLVDSQLGEYEEKIKQAKERAQIQFQEDFVSKLQSNIFTVEGQIRDLNAALRGISFGRDQYRFQVTPNPQYLRFYEMIMDELLMEGYGLFSQGFQDKHGEVVEELFRDIVDVDEDNPLAMTELERNLERFTDYRTYLNFDLVVKDEEGRESRLSRVMAKKSGGETQTPFYISVLASFVQLYRVRRSGSSDSTLRLIVFDEAYSKMDHQRIRESVRLIRDLGLQVLLSAPTEKLADIAPLVDKTLIVTRVQSQTKVMDFSMAGEGMRV